MSVFSTVLCTIRRAQYDLAKKDLNAHVTITLAPREWSEFKTGPDFPVLADWRGETPPNTVELHGATVRLGGPT